MAELPEVRQCQEVGVFYGASATAISENHWGIMNPNAGGSYATDAEVEGWKTLT
jgi:hypothetical protein